MNLVFSKFNDNLFILNQDLSLTISFSMLLDYVIKLSPEQKKFVSSANKTKCKIFETSQMSLIYKIKSLGAKTELCGTPHSIIIYSDTQPAKCTYCCLLHK